MCIEDGTDHIKASGRLYAVHCEVKYTLEVYENTQQAFHIFLQTGKMILLNLMKADSPRWKVLNTFITHNAIGPLTVCRNTPLFVFNASWEPSRTVWSCSDVFLFAACRWLWRNVTTKAFQNPPPSPFPHLIWLSQRVCNEVVFIQMARVNGGEDTRHMTSNRCTTQT